MKKIKAGIILFISLYVAWLVLAGTNRDELIIGGFASLLLSLIFSGRIQALGYIRLNPKALVYSVIYPFVFVRELIKSTLDVAKRVISPSLPINPGIVRVQTKLKSHLGRLFLANSITLTPGTMTVETDGDCFYIHWIDIQGDDIESSTKAIVATFEKYLEVMFG
jgi:multicomponent Na+:H+ antiporter subunit E